MSPCEEPLGCYERDGERGQKVKKTLEINKNTVLIYHHLVNHLDREESHNPFVVSFVNHG